MDQFRVGPRERRPHRHHELSSFVCSSFLLVVCSCLLRLSLASGALQSVFFLLLLLLLLYFSFFNSLHHPLQNVTGSATSPSLPVPVSCSLCLYTLPDVPACLLLHCHNICSLCCSCVRRTGFSSLLLSFYSGVLSTVLHFLGFLY